MALARGEGLTNMLSFCSGYSGKVNSADAMQEALLQANATSASVVLIHSTVGHNFAPMLAKVCAIVDYRTAKISYLMNRFSGSTERCTILPTACRWFSHAYFSELVRKVGAIAM